MYRFNHYEVGYFLAKDIKYIRNIMEAEPDSVSVEKCIYTQPASVFIVCRLRLTAVYHDAMLSQCSLIAE
jgi:hypothetical protein